MWDKQTAAPQTVEMQPQPANNRVTSIIPTTQPAKNPKRAAAGKAIAAKTKWAREEQRRALAESPCHYCK